MNVIDKRKKCNVLNTVKPGENINKIIRIFMGHLMCNSKPFIQKNCDTMYISKKILLNERKITLFKEDCLSQLKHLSLSLIKQEY